MRRALIAAIVVLAIVAGVFYWTRSRQAPPVPVEVAAARQAAKAWLALRINVIAAGPEDDLIVAVSGYDRRARQAAIVREATGGRWKGSGRGASEEPHTLLEGWASRLRLESSGRDVPFVTVREGADGEAVLRIAAANTPAAGTTLTATLTYDAGNARSNTVTMGEAPAARADRLLGRARQAELLGDSERLLTVANEIAAIDPESGWGDYYAGVAHEARGDRAAAADAFRRALARAPSGEEAPIGLVARIRQLSQ